MLLIFILSGVVILNGALSFNLDILKIKIDMSMSDTNSQVENNNDKILRMYKEGMSNVDIAKELGLGVGEVKLVINLFKGA